VAAGQYGINGQTHSAEVSLVVREDYQEQGSADPLHLTLAKREGLIFYGRGFGGEPLCHLSKNGFYIQEKRARCELEMASG
jgi:hypothetical protein